MFLKLKGVQAKSQALALRASEQSGRAENRKHGCHQENWRGAPQVGEWAEKGQEIAESD